MDSATRRVADTFIDFYVGFSSSEISAEQEASFNTSIDRLGSDGVIVDEDDDGFVSLDFTPLMIATTSSYTWLFHQLAKATGQSQEELVFDLRQHLDTLLDD